ncbi:MULTISPECIES: RHS repeat-associated core domain-containing protein [unclassified Lysobacter]|uniref:RHS repeat-associated core domain-containing protein n=1 Tax=unclassified Lysobacter TaxID=2635362 RepID=UPI001BE76479|nr:MULTISPECIES: RHS repeat-associated core domain-containing protein [unclassified Lysobacter]MBT2745867.1 Ig-like domain-containing protein [Lysobacter sp. ISL-42]MBT2749574.1 Ig-like domain-containing protein [Lysobacter sp. ISL-50]MBT2778782.1 Ig-like domain-containing protein [Lysobacter sp. ISL-54]MBT2781377.1 Ig-like domain-containing protein [Lysobacter sp. ISL-52]
MNRIEQGKRKGWRVGAMALALGLSMGAVGAALEPLPLSLSQQLALQSREVRAQLPDGRWLMLARDGRSLSLRTDATPAREVRHWPLGSARRLASVSVLADGRVLVWGGVDEGGRAQPEGLWFDSSTQTLTPARVPGLAPRAGHAATLLSDGRLLLSGGWTPGVAGVAKSEVWDERDGSVQIVPGAWNPPRLGHSSVLEADGRVRLSGGVDAQGRTLKQDDRFDPQRQAFAPAPRFTAIKERITAPVLSASWPSAKAMDVSPDARLSLRFSEPLQAAELNTSSVVLFGPGGRASVRVVPAEAGRLLFVTPLQALFPDSAYTLLIDGVRGRNGQSLATTAIDFKTAALNAAEAPVSTSSEVQVTGEGSTRACVQKNAWYTPCRARSELKDGVWYPGADNTDSRWRIYTPDQAPTPNPSMAKTAALYGVTVMRGRVVRVDEQPVANVEVSIGANKARTDADGWFTLLDAAPGWQELYVDGSTANSAQAEYGQFVVGVRVATGKLTELNYLLHLPRITARDKIQIASPLKQEMRIGHPDMPGLELRIPAGAVIRDRKGQLVTELAIVPTPVNRAPFPVKENHPMAFTLEPGGAQVQGLTPTASGGIRVYYPNYDRKPAGTSADFWIYDPREGWRVYGQGTVSADGRQFEPERGVALHQTMGGMYSVPNNDPPPKDGMPPDQDGKCPDPNCADQSAKGGGAGTEGDPVDLHTGDFIYADTDVTINDVVPLTIERHYRPRDMGKREFGLGMSLGFGHYLQRTSDDYAGIRIVLPNGSAVLFDRLSGTGAQGEWRQHGSRTAYAGAVMRSIFDSDPEQPYGRAYRVTLRDGSQMQFGSYNNTRLQWVQDRFGNQTRLVYNAGLLTQLVSPNGRIVTFTYDSQNRIKTAKDHTGRTWTYDYNDKGLLSTVTYPDQTTKRYTYLVSTFADDFDVCPSGINVDPRYCLYAKDHKKFGTYLQQHVMESVTDRRGNRVVYNEYPKYGSWIGRISKQTLADNSVYTFNYSNTPDGHLAVLVTRPDGVKRRVLFDENATLYPISDTYGYGTSEEQTYLYDRHASGQVRLRTDPLGRKIEYQYDSVGQTTMVTLLHGTQKAQTTRMSYYGNGQLRSVTDALDRITTLEYTDGCLSKIVDPLDRATHIQCNAVGQPIAVTDAKGYTSIYRYEGGELTATVDQVGRATGFAYDTLGRLVVVRDADGRISRRSYDNNDRVRKLVDPSQQETQLTYDNNGNVEAVLLPHGNGVTYVYDARDRLAERRDSLDQAEVWTYFPGDRLKSYKNRRNQTSSVAYDALGRPEVLTLADGSTQSIVYDAGDRRRQLVDSMTGVLTWEYDEFDRLRRESGDAGVVTYDYDAMGRRIGMTAGSQAKVEYRYDAADQLRRILQGAEEVAFEYDEIGRRKTMTLPNAVVAAYGFNEASDLIGLAYAKGDGSVLGSMGYGYDRSGQRTVQTGSWANTLLPAAASGNVFDDNHRQTAYLGQPLTYDANGNLTSDGTRTYVWNGRDQLVAIQQDGQTVASFEYDPLGRRIRKTENEQSVQYLYDGLDTVQETRGTQVGGVLTGLGVDERFARTDVSGRTYFLTDGLGSTKALTNASGAVVQQYDYTPYGQSQAMQSGFTNPYQYTGRELDENGLYYYRARYYHPGMARFISEDPVGLFGGINTYAYVQGSPVSMVDPTGLFGVPGAIAGGLIGAAGGAFGAWIQGGDTGAIVRAALLGATTGAIIGGTGAYLFQAGGVLAHMGARALASGASNALGQWMTNRNKPCPKFNWGALAGSTLGAGLSGFLAPAAWGTSFTGTVASQVAQRSIAGLPGAAVSTTGSITGGQIGKGR